MSGRKHSPETIKKMSDSHTGSKHSDETRNKISDTVKKSENSGRFKIGQSRAEGAEVPSIKISVFDQKTNQITTYDSLSEAAIALNITYKAISYHLEACKPKPCKNRYIFKKLYYSLISKKSADFFL
jgi:hypothetical protein